MLEGAQNIKQDAFSPKLKEKFNFDPSKGLWWQMLFTQWNLEEYNEYLDNPKLLITPWRSVRLFDNWFIETATMGPFYMTPLTVTPIVLYFLSCAQSSVIETALAFCFGIFMWSFFEYMLHRHLFHAERSWLPDHPYVIACHFVLNGIHHAYP